LGLTQINSNRPVTAALLEIGGVAKCRP
jgi:hypothetical protein